MWLLMGRKGGWGGACGHKCAGINKTSHILPICWALYLNQVLDLVRLLRFTRNYGVGSLALQFWGGELCVVFIGGCFLSLQCMQSTMTRNSGHTSGRKPNRGGGQSGSKRSMHEDLDAPYSSNWPPLSDSVTGSGSRVLLWVQSRPNL
jgi:hypothetical protein